MNSDSAFGTLRAGAHVSLVSSELWFPLASPLPPGRLGGAVRLPVQRGACGLVCLWLPAWLPTGPAGSAPGLCLRDWGSVGCRFRGAGGWGAELERTVALEHVIVQTSERPREESSGREAVREWGSCLPVPSFLSVPVPSVLVGVTRFAPLRFEMRTAGPQGAAAGVGAKLVPVRCQPALLRSQPPCRFHCIWKPRSVTGSIHAHAARPRHVPSGMPAVTSATCPCGSFSTVTVSGDSQVCFAIRAHVLLRCDGLDEEPGQSRGRSVCRIHRGQHSTGSIW